MASGEVDWEEMYIETATPDDNYNYLGEKEFIPNTLVLDNGDEIDVVFGITTSDGESANKEVAKHLIDGLKFALNQANNNLSSLDKVFEIYIMVTTNGSHGPYNNHSSGTAIDISRINGIKMILGVTEPIRELQEAFDDYEFIRENFGPYFKHKFSI